MTSIVSIDNLGKEIPRDRGTINAWARSFYTLNPDINRIINQHALIITNSYALIDSKMASSAHKANKFIKDNLSDVNITNILEKALIEYFMLGETFLYSEINEKDCKWNRLNIQNPDYMIVKRYQVDDNDLSYFMRPDENIRKICLSKKPEDILICDKLPLDIVNLIKNGENIPLNSYNIFHFANRQAPYELRGTSFIMPLFKTLIANEDNSLKIKQTLLDPMEIGKNNILKDVIYMRYCSIINYLEFWLNRKIIMPIAKINEFYGYKEGNKILIHPEVKFNRKKIMTLLIKVAQ